MSEHFIKAIEIENFKCFKNFKAEGFLRVNLIGGKNNVGKTAFLESCYIISNYASRLLNNNKFTRNFGASRIDKEWQFFEIIKTLITIQENRESVEFYTAWIKSETKLPTYKEAMFILNDRFKITLDEDSILPEYKYNNWSYYGNNNKISSFHENKYFHTIYQKNNPPLIINTNFITPCNSDNFSLKDMIDTLKLDDKHGLIIKILDKTFGITDIDIIKNRVMLKQDGKYYNLNEYGDGIKHFISIVLALSVNEGNVIYLDEVENGIHYTLFDDLWEVILEISKELNVQVFTTTHSKECIKSFSRVAQNLQESEVTFTQLKRMEDDSIKAGVYESDVFFNAIEQEHEVRGW